MYDEQTDRSLREGLAAIITPLGSRNFDTRVLEALNKSAKPSWRTIMSALRPAIAGAALSLSLMIGWVYLGGEGPDEAPTVAAAGYVEAPEFLLDQPHLTPASIRSLTRLAGIEERPAQIVPPRSSIDALDTTGRTL